ncbi:hypothetical protein SAMN06273572_101916 [Monaibacterium marinum]|uniref:Uncharacterized protein n=1 Tax=Pontivivens marinum TaxID=1690039 RepID=A0A2C9CP92_9RHOB|nr:hypothetical protein [Monaibacterium marinum]SOH93062.1 hypothetical protein SAMN06273572_101916 [Monaibacterium marinum]
MIEIAAGLAIANGPLALIEKVTGAIGKKDPNEAKEALIEIRGSVLDLKSALQDALERESLLRDEISEFKRDAKVETNFEDENGLLYQLDSDGKRVGAPYCHQCYVDQDKLFRAEKVDLESGHDYRCRNCKNPLGTKGPVRKSPLGVRYEAISK